MKISGITFNTGNAETIYAVQNEDGRVYYAKFGSKDVKYTHFAKQGDYEEVAIVNARLSLKSTSILYNLLLGRTQKKSRLM